MPSKAGAASARLNPYTPSFGVTPPLLVGRSVMLASFEAAIDGTPGEVGRATLVTGLRGVGKTVMLNALEDIAVSRGWLVISETATKGLAERITTEALPKLLAEHDPRASKRRITGVTLPMSSGGFVSTVEERHRPVANMRSQLTALTGLLAPNGTGVLITVDEIHRGAIDDLREITTVVQHAFREGLDVAFVGAGLKPNINELRSDRMLTFLRRAHVQELGRLSYEASARALSEPIVEGGRTIDDDALDYAVRGTQGYPFLVQFIGSKSWQEAGDAGRIQLAHARRAVRLARQAMGQYIYEPTLAALSVGDRTYLAAMASDDGPSLSSEIRLRMRAKAGYVGVYRQRLINAGIIEPAGYGRVQFTTPYLREYLREHVVSEAIALPQGRAFPPPPEDDE